MKRETINKFTREFVLNIPKTINENGCWIPSKWSRDKDGYVKFSIYTESFFLHRVVMSLYNNISYYDYNIETRHFTNCTKDCFNPEHISPGSHKDNMQDKIRDGNNHNLNKDVCSRCGGPYTTVKRRSGARKGMRFRRCLDCARKLRKKIKS